MQTTTERWADHIHSALVQKIVSGELQPGDMLNELPLADEFGVSRTPVREALQRLSAGGLAERGPRRAFVVRQMDMAAMGDLFEAVGEMEGLVAHMAALRMTELERQSLVRIVSEGERDDIDYALTNARFHSAIHSGAHNQVLSATLTDLNLRTLPWRVAQLRARMSRVQSSRIEHRAIMEAILAHDGDEAARRMRAHMAASFMGLVEIVRKTGSAP
ncbi:GntR family transcriptional regulator [Rhizobium gallicum]|nr:GntR family transcriptional regulator [Rhizobium gallicum]